MSIRFRPVEIVPPHDPLGTRGTISDRFPWFAASSVILTGLLTLLGWATGTPQFTSILPGMVSMNPITAVCFILSGVALWLRSDISKTAKERHKITRWFAATLAGVVALVGMLRLSDYLLSSDFGIDRILFPARLGGNQIAPNTAFALLLIGLAFVFPGVTLPQAVPEDTGNLRRRKITASSSATPLLLAVLVVAYLALVGYFFGVMWMYRVTNQIPMALNTAFCFCLLTLGELCTHSKREPGITLFSRSVGGVSARRLLPAAFLVPLVFGWLRLEGERRGFYGTDFGVALLVTATSSVMATLIWRQARIANHLDTQRQHAEEILAATNNDLEQRVLERTENLEATNRALRESEARFRATFEQAAVGIGHIDQDGHWILVNQRLCDIVGYTREELLARAIFQVSHPEYVEADRENIRRLLQGEITTSSREKRYVRKDGSFVWVTVTSSLVRDAAGAPDYIAGVVEDITARKQAETELSDQREFLRRVIDTDPSLIFVKDREGRFTLVNEATATLYGTTVAALTGKSEADFNPKLEQTMPLQVTDRAVIDGGQVQSISEEVVTDAQGNHRWFRTIKCPLISPGSSEVSHVLGVATEITVNKRLEEQLQQAQKLEAVGQLAGGVAHDFNNMLAAISGYTELLLFRPDLDTTMREELEEVYKAARRAATLTRQLLAFSRKQVIVPQLLDMGEAVTSVHGMLRRLIGEDIELVTVASATPTPVRADPGQIEQILINLVVNARDAMPQGGKVTVETQNVTLDAVYAAGYAEVQPGEYVLLAVSDNGQGMDAKTLGHVFEPFFTTKEVGKGTGLGLAMVYGIVKQNSGHVAVYSEPGLGTTFKIYLPRAVATSEETPGGFSTEDGMPDYGRGQDQLLVQGNGNILLVEDEPVVRAVARDILMGAGYTVWEAGNGEEALRIAEQRGTEIDLLLTDVVMPQMGGRELMQQVSPLYPGIRVLFMSGYTDDAVVRHGVLTEEVAFLQKPFTAMALTQKVGDVLRHRPKAAQT